MYERKGANNAGGRFRNCNFKKGSLGQQRVQGHLKYML